MQAVQNHNEFTYPQVLRILAEELITLTPKHYQLLMFIAARTYRFGKCEERIPLRHFTDGIETDAGWIQHPVGMTKNIISSGLQELEEAGLIVVTKCRNNVKKIGIAIKVLTEGVDEMVSKLRHGKQAKKKITDTESGTISSENYGSVSLNQGNQYPYIRETSIPKSGTPNIRSRSISFKNNNGAEALEKVATKAKEKSAKRIREKVDRQPKHKQALHLFKKLAKESHPTMNLSSPTPAAIRNMRLATDKIPLPEVLEFAKSVAENWESIIIHNLSYLHKANANLHIAPCVNTFGMMAAKFLEDYQREQAKEDKHSSLNKRRAPKLTLVDTPKVVEDTKPAYRTMTKAELYAAQGRELPSTTAPSKYKEQIKESADRFEREVQEYMAKTGLDYESAANELAFGDI